MIRAFISGKTLNERQEITCSECRPQRGRGQAQQPAAVLPGGHRQSGCCTQDAHTVPKQGDWPRLSSSGETGGRALYGTGDKGQNVGLRSTRDRPGAEDTGVEATAEADQCS